MGVFKGLTVRTGWAGIFEWDFCDFGHQKLGRLEDPPRMDGGRVEDLVVIQALW